MEVENHDNTAAGGGGGGGESVISSVTDDKDELEESSAQTKSGSVTEPGEAEHPEQNDTTTGRESEMESVPSVPDFDPSAGEADEVKEVDTVSSTSVGELSAEESETLTDTSPTSQTVSTNIKELMPELTLVLTGDTNSIEVGLDNILLDHDDQTHDEQFSSKLYDLCGRHICVINMLDQQNTNKHKFPLNQGIHAFLLLVPNGLHSSHYSSGVQWLEEAFGKESLSYLMTVVTHDSDEECDGALTDLKACSSFVEERYHTCTKSMRDEHEIIALLKKIDVMVSDNDPHCYSGPTCGDIKEQEEDLDHKSHEEEKTDVFHHSQRVDQPEERAATTQVKCNSVHNGKHSEKKNDNTARGGGSEIKSVASATCTSDVDTSGNKDKVRKYKFI
ncbi:uncharacterized protein LOC111236070 [Seriola dumerili]|uniref:uncharacterized protein LOC111236070 n=1 Tax=Seriola dumerili TaxID=41447 RepID=UPI000BBED7DF|nr:uncharacterized protein LOC111236070 [Seriola dumerili]